MSRRNGILFLTLVTLLWGVSFCLTKALHSRGESTFAFTAGALALRLALAGVVIWAWAIWRGGRRFPTRDEWVQGLWIGTFAGLGLLFQAEGINHTHASTAAFLTQAATVFVPIWVFVRTRQRPDRLLFVALAFVLLGLGILSGFNPLAFRVGYGEAAVLVSAAFFAGMILTIESHRHAHNDKRVVAALFMIVAAGWSGLSAWPLGARWEEFTVLFQPEAMVVFLILALLCTGLSFLWMTEYQPAISSTEAGVLYCLEPVWASLFSLFLPHILAGALGIQYANEQVTLAMVAGGSAVLIGSVLLAVRPAPTLT